MVRELVRAQGLRLADTEPGCCRVFQIRLRDYSLESPETNPWQSLRKAREPILDPGSTRYCCWGNTTSGHIDADACGFLVNATQ